MPHVSFEDALPYAPADLYALVMDIGRYPQIFEAIRHVAVRVTGPHSRSVDVTAQTPLSTLSYSCDVQGTPPQRIDIKATSGAFESMNAQWRFEPLPGGGTKVRYEMEFDFGGLGFMNAVAAGLIETQAADMRRHLKDYAARTLPPAPAAAAPKPGR